MEYRQESGYWWPADDRECSRAVIASLPDIDLVLRYVTNRSLCVQAGGNCGVWANRLADEFATVVTFEPDAVNFAALAANTAGKGNVVRIQSALGDRHDWIGLDREAGNCGAHFVSGSGQTPTLRIDDLNVPSCGLIYLDIEGAELPALRGAAMTIKRHKPVLAFEDKGLSERFGHKRGDAERWLADEFGYAVVERPHRDVVMACRE